MKLLNKPFEQKNIKDTLSTLKAASIARKYLLDNYKTLKAAVKETGVSRSVIHTVVAGKVQYAKTNIIHHYCGLLIGRVAFVKDTGKLLLASDVQSMVRDYMRANYKRSAQTRFALDLGIAVQEINCILCNHPSDIKFNPKVLDIIGVGNRIVNLTAKKEVENGMD